VILYGLIDILEQGWWTCRSRGKYLQLSVTRIFSEIQSKKNNTMYKSPEGSMATLIREKMFINYNSSLWKEHKENQSFFVFS
jgi:hypothetical protein